MNVDSIGCSEGPSSPMPMPQLEIVLAYQDLPTGLHARQFLNHVLNQCQLGSEFKLTLWKLDLFHLPELCEQAVHSASEAALVLLSLRGDLGLDAKTENWLSQWIKRRDRDECALAVLIDCDMQRLDSLGHTLFWLQDATQLSQVRLFVGFVPPVRARHISTGTPESDHTETLLAAPKQMPHPPNIFHEGGINE